VAERLRQRVTARLPAVNGIMLALALALAAMLLSRAAGSWSGATGRASVSPVLCAILLGLIWRNTIGVGPRWLPGLEWVTHRLLRLGIALVGLRLTLGGAGSVALMALPVVIACIVTALALSMALGRYLRLTQPLRILLAAGTAICGCTAVVAVAPVVRARPAETAIALTCVVLLGALGMLLYPWVGQTLFAANPQSAGIFLGTSIHDTSQVVGASLIYAQQFGAPDVVPVAGFTKLLRNLTLLLIIPLAASWAAEGSSASEPAQPRMNWRGHLKRAMPGFLVAFVLLAVVRNVGDHALPGGTWRLLWERMLSAASSASELFLVCGMTAVGLGVVLRDLRQVGWRALVAAFAVAVAVAGCSLSMIFGVRHLIG
jgi:uncharacterized integral membrane protein (TIGR00698 family)